MDSLRDILQSPYQSHSAIDIPYPKKQVLANGVALFQALARIELSHPRNV